MGRNVTKGVNSFVMEERQKASPMEIPGDCTQLPVSYPRGSAGSTVDYCNRNHQTDG